MPELKQTFSPGEVIAGNYRILSIAGSGGMGVVYRALDLRLERTVALKFLPPELNTGVRDKERFLREARTASSLDHQHRRDSWHRGNQRRHDVHRDGLLRRHLARRPHSQ